LVAKITDRRVAFDRVVQPVGNSEVIFWW